MALFPDGARSPLARAVSAEVRSLMAARRVTGRTLASAIGLKSHNYLAVRLRDEKAFSLDDLELIAAYFSVDPATLISDAEHNHGERLWAESEVALEDPVEAAKYAALRESRLGFWWDDFAADDDETEPADAAPVSRSPIADLPTLAQQRRARPVPQVQTTAARKPRKD